MENQAQLEAVKALIKVQEELKPVKKNADNLYFKSKYADLCAIWEACASILNKHGFAISQSTRFYEDKFILETTLWHIGGGSFAGHYWINPKDVSDPQKLLACCTYARRASLSALCGIVVEGEDYDGNHAAEPSSAQSTQEAVDSTGNNRFGVQAVKEEPFKSAAGKSLTRYKVISDAGEAYSTITKKTADEANRARRESKDVYVTFKKDKWGLGILELKVCEEIDTEKESF